MDIIIDWIKTHYILGSLGILSTLGSIADGFIYLCKGTCIFFPILCRFLCKIVNVIFSFGRYLGQLCKLNYLAVRRKIDLDTFTDIKETLGVCFFIGNINKNYSYVKATASYTDKKTIYSIWQFAKNCHEKQNFEVDWNTSNEFISFIGAHILSHSIQIDLGLQDTLSICAFNENDIITFTIGKGKHENVKLLNRYFSS